jgi:hypothetical protein
MLAGLCYSLHCFSFTDPSRKELRKRERRKKAVD